MLILLFLTFKGFNYGTDQTVGQRFGGHDAPAGMFAKLDFLAQHHLTHVLVEDRRQFRFGRVLDPWRT